MPPDTVTKEDCKQTHEGVDKHFEELKAAQAAMREDIKRIMVGVCGDVEGHGPGILQRLAALEWRVKLGIAIGGTIGTGCVGYIIRQILA